MMLHGSFSALSLPKAFLCLALASLVMLSACKKENGQLLGPTPNGSQVATDRSEQFYAFSAQAQNLTLARLDTVSWQPPFAWYTLAVTSTGGSASIELMNRSGTRLWCDSLVGSGTVAEDRSVAVAMPLHLRLSLHDFTGSLSCVLGAARCGFGVLTPQLRVVDTSGHSRDSFQVGEEIRFIHALANSTGRTLVWTRGMSNPFAHVVVRQARTTVRDSWHGFMFAAVPSTGNLANGDSLVTTWELPSTMEPLDLLVGDYVAVATQAFAVAGGGMVSGQAVEFSVVP